MQAKWERRLQYDWQKIRRMVTESIRRSWTCEMRNRSPVKEWHKFMEVVTRLKIDVAMGGTDGANLKECRSFCPLGVSSEQKTNDEQKEGNGHSSTISTALALHDDGRLRERVLRAPTRQHLPAYTCPPQSTSLQPATHLCPAACPACYVLNC